MIELDVGFVGLDFLDVGLVGLDVGLVGMGILMIEYNIGNDENDLLVKFTVDQFSSY